MRPNGACSSSLAMQTDGGAGRDVFLGARRHRGEWSVTLGSAKGFGRGVFRSPAWRSRSTLIVGLLTLATLALAGLMAYEAYDASRSHRATAERALRDYAAFAAWELLANATDNLRTALDAALTPATGVKATSPYERLPSPAMLAPLAANTLACADSTANAARYYF